MALREQVDAEYVALVDSWANHHKYKVHSFGQDPKVFLLGEHHKSQDHVDAQDSLISLLKPGYLLSESFGSILGERVCSDDHSADASFLNPEDRNRMAWFSLSIVGCDLDFSAYQNTLAYIASLKGLDLDDIKQLKTADRFVDQFREMEMGLIISRWAFRSMRPIIGIYGADHLQEDGLLTKTLKECGISHYLINQTKGITN